MMNWDKTPNPDDDNKTITITEKELIRGMSKAVHHTAVQVKAIYKPAATARLIGIIFISSYCMGLGSSMLLTSLNKSIPISRDWLFTMAIIALTMPVLVSILVVFAEYLIRKVTR